MRGLFVPFLATLVVGVVLSGISLTSAAADEEKVPLDKLPDKVRAAVKAKFAGAELVSAQKESEDGKALYEVAIKHKGQTIEVTLTPEGTITEIEKEIAAKDLPKEVAAALAAKYPKATFQKVEEILKGETISYEVLLVTAEKKMFEVKLDPQGKILEEESKDKQEEKKNN